MILQMLLLMLQIPFGYNSTTDALQTASGTWSVQASNYDDIQGSGYYVQGSGVEIQ